MLPGWHRADVAGRPADAFDPPGGPPRCVLVFLHAVGLESLADNPAYTNALASRRAACVVPFAGRTWWNDKVTPEFDPALSPERYLLDHVRPWALDRWQVPERALGAFGISMGGQGALRLGFRHPRLFPAVGGVASAIDFHDLHGEGTSIDAMYRSKEAARQDTATLHVNAADAPPTIAFACDPADADWFRGNDRLHEKLAALGVPHAADLATSAGGHSWGYFDAMAGWIVAALADGMGRNRLNLLG